MWEYEYANLLLLSLFPLIIFFKEHVRHAGVRHVSHCIAEVYIDIDSLN